MVWIIWKESILTKKLFLEHSIGSTLMDTQVNKTQALLLKGIKIGRGFRDLEFTLLAKHTRKKKKKLKPKFPSK